MATVPTQNPGGTFRRNLRTEKDARDMWGGEPPNSRTSDRGDLTRTKTHRGEPHDADTPGAHTSPAKGGKGYGGHRDSPSVWLYHSLCLEFHQACVYPKFSHTQEGGFSTCQQQQPQRRGACRGRPSTFSRVPIIPRDDDWPASQDCEADALCLEWQGLGHWPGHRTRSQPSSLCHPVSVGRSSQSCGPGGHTCCLGRPFQEEALGPSALSVFLSCRFPRAP